MHDAKQKCYWAQYLEILLVNRLLRSWVRIPPGAWMFVCCKCCVLSGRGLCDELITCPEGSYRLWCVVVCDLVTSRMRRPWPALGSSAIGEKNCLKKCLWIMWCMELHRLPSTSLNSRWNKEETTPSPPPQTIKSFPALTLICVWNNKMNWYF